MFLSRYDMQSAVYKNLYQVNKLALTLLVTKKHFAKKNFRASKDNAFSCSHRCCIPLGWGNLERRDRGKGNKLSLSPSQLYRQDSMQ
jgi:hypothetical protein